MGRGIEDSLSQALLILSIGAIAFVISGCGGNNKETGVDPHQSNTVTITFPSGATVEQIAAMPPVTVSNTMTMSDSPFKTESDQDGGGVRTDPTLRLAQQGGAINDGTGKADGLQDNKDNRVDNRVNTTTTYITNPKVGEGTVIEASETPAEYLPTSEVIVRYDDCKQVNNRSHHWLYEIDLTTLPKRMKVTYPNCDFSFIVEDTAKSQDFPNSKLEKGSYYAGGTTEHGKFPAVFSKAGCTDNIAILEKL